MTRPAPILLVVLAIVAGCSHAKQEGVATTTAPPAAGTTSEKESTEPNTIADAVATTDGDFETGASGWIVGVGTATVGRDAGTAKFGDWSGTLTSEAVQTATSIARDYAILGSTAGETFTASVWVKAGSGAEGHTAALALWEIGGAAAGEAAQGRTVTLSRSWQPITVTKTLAQNDRTSLRLELYTQVDKGDVVIIDGARLAHGHSSLGRGSATKRIQGAEFPVERRSVRIDGSTLTCGGEGDDVFRNGVRLWSHFACLQPTFPRGRLAGPDAVFRVHVVSREAFLITDAHFSRY